MKIAMPEPNSNFLTSQDVKTGDIIIIASEAEEQEKEFQGKKKKVVVVDVELSGGEKKTLTMNATSVKWMIEKYGEESNEWLGEKVPVFVILQNVQGEFKKVIYLGEEPDVT